MDMNLTHNHHRVDPRTAARSAGLAIAFLATSALLSSCANSADSRNESYKLLRSVPVPVSDVAISSLGDLDLEEGQVLKQQTYTVSPDGDFTLNRLVESEVGSIRACFDALSPSRAKRLDMEPFSGVYVRSVRSKGPLGRAGVRSRDAILSFAGETVSSHNHLTHLIESRQPGTEVTVEYNHRGEISSASVKIAGETRAESIRALQRELPVLDDRARSGLKIVELPEDIHSIMRGEETGQGGLLILKMLPGGPAFFSDLRVRDFITAVDGMPVTTHVDYNRALSEKKSGQDVLFQAQRDGHTVQTMVNLDHDATSNSGFNLLSLVKYKKKPEERQFSMIWEILFHSEKSHSVVKRENVGQHTTSSNWGAFLDLLRYRRSPTKTRFDLLWILPITFGNDEGS